MNIFSLSPESFRKTKKIKNVGKKINSIPEQTKKILGFYFFAIKESFDQFLRRCEIFGRAGQVTMTFLQKGRGRGGLRIFELEIKIRSSYKKTSTDGKSVVSFLEMGLDRSIIWV